MKSLCRNRKKICLLWGSIGECETNLLYMASNNSAASRRGRGAAIHLGPSLFPVRVPRRVMTPLLMSPQKQNPNHHCPSHPPGYYCLVLYSPPTKSKRSQSALLAVGSITRSIFPPDFQQGLRTLRPLLDVQGN